MFQPVNTQPCARSELARTISGLEVARPWQGAAGLPVLLWISPLQV